MDSPNSSPDQEKGGEQQQPSELPILSDKDNNLGPGLHIQSLEQRTLSRMQIKRRVQQS